MARRDISPGENGISRREDNRALDVYSTCTWVINQKKPFLIRDPFSPFAVEHDGDVCYVYIYPTYSDLNIFALIDFELNEAVNQIVFHARVGFIAYRIDGIQGVSPKSGVVGKGENWKQKA